MSCIRTTMLFIQALKKNPFPHGLQIEKRPLAFRAVRGRVKRKCWRENRNAFRRMGSGSHEKAARKRTHAAPLSPRSTASTGSTQTPQRSPPTAPPRTALSYELRVARKHWHKNAEPRAMCAFYEHAGLMKKAITIRRRQLQHAHHPHTPSVATVLRVGTGAVTCTAQWRSFALSSSFTLLRCCTMIF